MEPEVTVGGQSFTSKDQGSHKQVTQRPRQLVGRGSGVREVSDGGLDTWGLGEVEAGFLDSWELGRQR